MEPNSQFNLTQFEQDVEQLLVDYQRLKKDHAQLQAKSAAQDKKMQQLRGRINQVIARVQALETEIDSKRG